LKWSVVTKKIVIKNQAAARCFDLCDGWRSWDWDKETVEVQLGWGAMAHLQTGNDVLLIRGVSLKWGYELVWTDASEATLTQT